MPTYTVIGLYDDGETFADHVEATGPQAAMTIAADAVRQAYSDIQIIGAIEGALTMFPPCEDSGKAAYASDLCGEEADEEASEHAAREAGWTFDELANVYRLEDAGDGMSAMDANKTWRELCKWWDIPVR